MAQAGDLSTAATEEQNAGIGYGNPGVRELPYNDVRICCKYIPQVLFSHAIHNPTTMGSCQLHGFLRQLGHYGQVGDLHKRLAVFGSVW